jgi:hypothetical protein
MALDERAVAEIKILHQACELTLAEIGARCGISATAVSHLARKEGWTPRSQLLGHAARSFRPATLQMRARLVRRFYDVMNKKLDQMEKAMAADKLSAEEFEREGKTTAAMFGSVAKAVAESDGEKRQKPKASEPAPVSASDEAERLHREIIERFERIQKRRNAEAGSG